MKLFSIKAVVLFLLMFNFTINYFILNSSYEYFFQIPINSRLLFFLFFAVLFFLVNYFFMISSTIKEINWFIFIFLFFSLLNFKNIDPVYFWETIPDAVTYKNLGLSFLECFRLSLSCNESPYLLFPIGQPLLSGLFFKYIYSYAYLINTIYIAIVIYILDWICKNHYKKTTGLGFLYLLSHSLIFELTPMQISEVTFTFFIFLSVYVFLKKYKNYINISSILYGISILIRPIGIVFMPIFIYIFRKKIKGIIPVFLILLIAASLNYFTSEKFTVSDINVDSREDGLVQNSGYFDYFVEIIKSDAETRRKFILFVSENYSNLYGESSKDCIFSETCFFYNPKYNIDGTVPKYFSNSSTGERIEKYLKIFYELRAPQKFGMILLPLFTLFPLLFKRFKIEKLFALSSLLLIFPTLLTVEYGNRWNFTLLFLTSLIIEMTTSNMIYKQKSK